MTKWILHICVFLCAVCAASLAAAQTNVITTGGSANSIPKFSGSNTVVNSAITDQSGVITFGPVTLPFSGSGGGIFTTGSNSGIGFVRQSLTSWPNMPAAGDLFSWYNSDGTARLFTYTTGNLLHIASGGQITVGPFQRTDAGKGGGITTVGTNNGLAFTRQTLTSWPTTPAAGDLFSWYDFDGTARLYTYQTGNILAVKNTGELDLTGPLVFPDGSIQTKAQVQGPAGPQGPEGPQGPTGPQGPAGSAPTIAISGNCLTDSFSTPYVLNGLGQTKSTDCTYGPGSPTFNPVLGTILPRTGTLGGLQVTQTSLGSSGFGAQIQIYLEPFNQNGGWQATSIKCTTPFQSNPGVLNSTVTCGDLIDTVAIQAGEKILVVATPTGGGTSSPVSAMLTIN